MLARGVLCRLAADVPKTSTHDLPQLVRLLRRTVATHNGLPLPSLCVLSRAYKTSLAYTNRTYATTARATKPTATVKTAVKKAAAKKTAPKKAVAKKPKRETAAKKKTAPRKKKAAAKPKRAKKVLTDEQKQKALVRELRVKALKEPSVGTVGAHNAFFADNIKDGKKLSDVAGQFRHLTPAEREHWNHIANERNADRKAKFDAWVRTFTPDQIRIANNARAQLRKLLKGKTKKQPAHTKKIQDDRQYKAPISAYTRFFKERYESGDFKTIAVTEASKLIANEWKSLSAGEKKKYIDAFQADKERHAGEYERTYGHKP